MENVTPWGLFWTAFFGCLPATLPIMLGQILTHRRQMAELRLNTRLTAQTQVVSLEAASKVSETADKVDSATRAQASTASAAATIAKSAAKEAKAEKEEAKVAAHTTVRAVERLSVDVVQLKEIVNGYLTERMAAAHKAGYAMGAHDEIVKKVDDHAQRIIGVETKLDRIEGKLETILVKSPMSGEAI